MDLMRVLKERLRTSAEDNYTKALYWSAFTMAFFGFLRVNEFAHTAADAGRQLRLGDVTTVDHHHIRLTIRASKTDQFGHGYSILLQATSRSVCAVKAYRRFLAVRRDTAPLKPLYVLPDGAPLTRTMVNRTLKLLLADHPLRDRINTHCFRIGAATTAAANHAPLDTIKKAGRWRSDCFATYVRGQVAIDNVLLYGPD